MAVVRSTWKAGLSALAFLAAGSAVLAASDHRSGDGSGTNNPDLMPGGFDSGLGGAPGTEPYHPFVNIDWSVGLRGAYTIGPSGGRYETVLTPTLSGSFGGGRWTSSFSATADLVREQDGEPRLSSLSLEGAGTYQLDSVTLASGSAGLSLTQSAADPDGTPTSVAIEPIVTGASLGGEITRQFGRFNLTGRGSFDRSVTGPSTLTDTSTVENADQNVTFYGGGLRLGLEVSPIWSVFADGEIGLERFDQPSKTLLVKLDSTTYALRAGVAGQWTDVLSVESSVGVSLRRFADPGLSDVTATLYDASVTFRPDPTLTLTGAFSTSIDAPGSGSGSARISYEATGEVAYEVNRWLSLRGSVGWNHATFAGSPVVETGYDFGFGADYRVNAHTALTADYTFSHSETTPDPAEDTHVIALGLRLSR